MYKISCWLYCDGLISNEFSVFWNGATLFDKLNIGDTGWTNLQFQASATSTATVLEFGFRDDPSYLGLDDIAVYPSVSVPAPAQFQGVTVTNGMISFSWRALAGEQYQVQYTTNLAQNQWTDLGGPLSTTNSNSSLSTNDCQPRQSDSTASWRSPKTGRIGLSLSQETGIARLLAASGGATSRE